MAAVRDGIARGDVYQVNLSRRIRFEGDADPRALADALGANDFAGGRFDRALGALDFRPVRGFMKGFVDLVFEANGRFHLLDYKSNHLGGQVASYGADALEAEMERSGYFLQYAIYGVALHRLLRLRLPGYDPDRHLGDAFYVFLRGVDELDCDLSTAVRDHAHRYERRLLDERRLLAENVA